MTTSPNADKALLGAQAKPEPREDPMTPPAKPATPPMGREDRGLTDLPIVELVAGALYWIKCAHTNPEDWTVASWEHGCWWGIDGKETTPRAICGPIPRPGDSASADTRANAQPRERQP